MSKVAFHKWVYRFDEVEAAEKSCKDWDGVRTLLGGKGANLARMTSLNLPVPFGFSLTTEVCTHNMKHNALPDGAWDQVMAALEVVEQKAGKKFGQGANPLLFSCRSGSKFSMPGMMDTVLNLGLNDTTVQAVAKLSSPRFAFDSYRRLVQGFGSVVLGMDDEAFEKPLKAFKQAKGYKWDTDMTAENWQDLSEAFKGIILKHTGKPFPQAPLEQLRASVHAVLDSWNSKRAFSYRNAAKISHDLGTACNIQMMVFGNMGDTSATGVGFTRNPADGDNKLYGEYLVNAQGEDVVAGVRTPSQIRDLGKDFPVAFKELVQCCDTLEHFFKNMQDIEFTVENKKLYMLQTRDGKRTAVAAVKMAIDMVNEGLIDKDTALRRVSPTDVNRLLHPQLDLVQEKAARDTGRVLCKGINASPGGGVGRVYFDADTAQKKNEEGQHVILVRAFTKPDDVHGFFASRGILTAEGGATSHAAVVARQFGVPCICGAADISIDMDKLQFSVGDRTVREGEYISLDGSTGEVFLGEIESKVPDFEDQKELSTLLQWADAVCARENVRNGGKDGFPSRGLQVYANADSGIDAQRARKFGAVGIGLCRTEHMFFDKARLPFVQEMILAKTVPERVAGLNKLLPMQRGDFEDIFRAMDALPTVLRLIDPPLHEFLPEYDELIDRVATLRASKECTPAELKKEEDLLESVKGMHESNPMLGLRGVRLSIMMPEIVQMQIRAIFEAACNVKSAGGSPHVEIMIPLTGHINELKTILPALEEVCAKVFSEKGVTVPYKFGTMIETPRACLVAFSLAEKAEFFSCGTNDLTQMTYGYSRDDAERKFLLYYVDHAILPANPFQTLDHNGVGRLIKLACEEGRRTRPGISVGICGEHGGDPESAKLVHEYGFDYVSCSAFRVPVMRLACAHAVLDCDVTYCTEHFPRTVAKQ